MDCISALTQRVSSPRLVDPAPDSQQREQIFRAALRAADHGALRPWHFLVVEGDDRLALGELYLQAAEAREGELSEARRDKVLSMPLRAPLIVVAVAHCIEHPKVPMQEMVISTGAAVQNMLNAAFALGVGAYWRTGEMAYDPVVKQGLSLSEADHIVGFLYLGTVPGAYRPLPNLAVADFFKPWPEK